MTREIDVDLFITKVWVIAFITFIGIGVGMLTTPAYGYIAIGFGYLVLAIGASCVYEEMR